MRAREWIQEHPFTTSFLMVTVVVEAVVIIFGGSAT